VYVAPEQQNPTSYHLEVRWFSELQSLRLIDRAPSVAAACSTPGCLSVLSSRPTRRDSVELHVQILATSPGATFSSARPAPADRLSEFRCLSLPAAATRAAAAVARTSSSGFSGDRQHPTDNTRWPFSVTKIFTRNYRRASSGRHQRRRKLVGDRGRRGQLTASATVGLS